MWNLYYIKKADSPVHCYTEVISFTSGFDKIKGEPHSLYLIFNYEKDSIYKGMCQFKFITNTFSYYLK